MSSITAADQPDVAAHTTSDGANATIQRVIEALAGPGARLREDQQTAVAALVREQVDPSGTGPRVLVVQRTGWGKSAVYWVATALRRAAGHGPTLVVSPLLSLMRDQVAAAGKAGLRAATINSANVGEWSAIESALAADELDVVLVSPERLANPGFGARVLDGLAGNLGLLVIDEAHAVSDWGHDFRPDYRRVSDVLQRLNPATPVLATTATANQRVTDDVAAQLGRSLSEHTESAGTLVLRGPLARSSLQLSVVGRLTPIQRYGWVVDHLPRLPGAGIVYALTVADAERLADAVRTVHGDALPVAAYTGQLDAETRHRLEDQLRANEVKALIATSALGMGYDKPDLGFVVHVGAPPSPVSYYQQVGRAGRAIEHAAVVLLPSPADDGVWDYFATATIPDEQQMRTLIAALGAADRPLTVPALEAETGLRRTRVELMLKQLAVDGIVERTSDGWLGTGQEWVYDAEHYDGVVAVRRREADIMRAYTRGERCLMQLLQESLDDPTATPCGRCSVCLNRLPDGLEEEPQVDTLRQISTGLRSRAHILEPRKMWPGGEFGARGRIPNELMAETGRALVHADAPEWADTLDRATRDDPDAVEELAAAAVATLSAWRTEWAARPEVVVPLAAAGGPLAGRIGDRLAQAGRLERATISVAGDPPDRDVSGPAEAAHWRQAITVDERGADAQPAAVAALARGAQAEPGTQPGPGNEPGAAEGSVAVADRVVLLVTDASWSQWPVTVAVAKLREAGARMVLPLLIHRRV